MDTFERRTPHYLRIYRDLKEKISAGTFAPGERLPAQRDLAESHGVTVMTVRQALQLLEQEELVVSRHGLGTFVAPQRMRYEVGTPMSQSSCTSSRASRCSRSSASGSSGSSPSCTSSPIFPPGSRARSARSI